MVSSIDLFEAITRKAYRYTSRSTSDVIDLHPFDRHNIHEKLPKNVRRLFDDGHFSQATFEAVKYIDKKVKKLSKIRKSGYQLIMIAFNETSPLVKLTDLTTTSEVDEQQGYKFLFAGAVMAIRNPRGHEVAVHE
ncbi:MAG: TIGR02391 family protein, partial [Candidatus Marinimicrobia bacterium]|nr:TIGR02391 family protein [Candidatus Neomarinimicrobiota bacterium]